VKALIRAARLPFLIVGFILFVLGSLWAVLSGATFSPGRVLLGYTIILCAQLSVHLSDEYFDVGSDRPGRSTIISGGTGVLLEQPGLRQPVKWIALGMIVASLALGLVLLRIYPYPWWIYAFVILGNLLGWFYSAPPLRFSERGLGEICYTIIGGFLIPGMGYLVLKGSLDAGGLYLLLPLVLYGLASILSGEMPDVEDDRLAHKATWLTRMGRAAGFMLIGGLLIVATGYFFLSARLFPRLVLDPRLVGMASLLPMGVGVLGILKRPRERQPATGIAAGIMFSMAAFCIFVDGYLVYLVVH
jgi:1,4-dihydroxy-2-naphthoate octaprenyltransferase